MWRTAGSPMPRWSYSLHREKQPEGEGKAASKVFRGCTLGTQEQPGAHAVHTSRCTSCCTFRQVHKLLHTQGQASRQAGKRAGMEAGPPT
jgi:hypothetical protein